MKIKEGQITELIFCMEEQGYLDIDAYLEEMEELKKEGLMGKLQDSIITKVLINIIYLRIEYILEQEMKE